MNTKLYRPAFAVHDIIVDENINDVKTFELLQLFEPFKPLNPLFNPILTA